jgi:hypothetical protein
MKTMDHNVTGSDYTGPGLLIIMWINTMITIFEKANITFVLSAAVSILAGYYYILQIRKTKREEKSKNQ